MMNIVHGLTDGVGAPTRGWLRAPTRGAPTAALTVALFCFIFNIQPAYAEGILVPGSGFAGPTLEPAALGDPSAPGYDAKAIARWDVVPYQTFNGNFNVGVVAFHINDIDRVEFSVNGGSWMPVTTMTLNPQTNVIEYWATLDISKFSVDGSVEVRAVAYPKIGMPRVLESLPLIVDVTPTAVVQTIHVSLSGSDKNDGSVGAPVASLSRALDIVTDGGTIQIEDPGRYRVDLSDYRYATDHFYTHWTTIQPRPGLTRNDVIIDQTNAVAWNGSAYVATAIVSPHVSHLRWNNVAFDFHTVNQIAPLNDDAVWFDHVKWYDSAGWADPAATGDAPVQSHAVAYVTDSLATDTRYGFIGAALVRNSACINISTDVFANTLMAINSTVNHTRQAIAGSHNDLGQHYSVPAGGIVENRIVYGLSATDIESNQNIFLGPGDIFQNFAFVDYSVNNIATALNDNFCAQFAGTEKHILLQNVSFPNQTLLFRTDIDLSAANFLITDSTFKGIANQTSGGATQTLPAGVTLRTAVYGDVSQDAEVTAYDAALTARGAVGLDSLTPWQGKIADVSGDGQVTAYDAALIAQRAVGLIDKFPVET